MINIVWKNKKQKCFRHQVLIIDLKKSPQIFEFTLQLLLEQENDDTDDNWITTFENI